MNKNNNKTVGWIIAFLEKWPDNIESRKGKQNLYYFFRTRDFLKIGSNVYARQILEEEFEEWKYKIKFIIPKDGSINTIFVTSEQWDNMKLFASSDKFKKD